MPGNTFQIPPDNHKPQKEGTSGTIVVEDAFVSASTEMSFILVKKGSFKPSALRSIGRFFVAVDGLGAVLKKVVHDGSDQVIPTVRCPGGF